MHNPSRRRLELVLVDERALTTREGWVTPLDAFTLAIWKACTGAAVFARPDRGVADAPKRLAITFHPYGYAVQPGMVSSALATFCQSRHVPPGQRPTCHAWLRLATEGAPIHA